jgi:hypothetical protein
MVFEGQGQDSWRGTSPGGFEFGIQGFTYGPPVLKSITFFLDGSCMVCDQYGRHIRCAVLADGSEVRFADRPPDGSKENVYAPRAQFANHERVLKALAAERIDWLSYEVKWRDKSGRQITKSGLTAAKAAEIQTKVLQDGCSSVLMDRTINCAGWPQLPYEELKKLPELPPTPEEDLRRIVDPDMRRAALRIRREVDESRAKELQAVEEE